MARESLSEEVEFERKHYGVELFRKSNEENIKITNSELSDLEEILE